MTHNQTIVEQKLMLADLWRQEFEHCLQNLSNYCENKQEEKHFKYLYYFVLNSLDEYKENLDINVFFSVNRNQDQILFFNNTAHPPSFQSFHSFKKFDLLCNKLRSLNKKYENQCNNLYKTTFREYKKYLLPEQRERASEILKEFFFINYPRNSYEEDILKICRSMQSDDYFLLFSNQTLSIISHSSGVIKHRVTNVEYKKLNIFMKKLSSECPYLFVDYLKKTQLYEDKKLLIRSYEQERNLMNNIFASSFNAILTINQPTQENLIQDMYDLLEDNNSYFSYNDEGLIVNSGNIDFKEKKITTIYEAITIKKENIAPGLRTQIEYFISSFNLYCPKLKILFDSICTNNKITTQLDITSSQIISSDNVKK